MIQTMFSFSSDLMYSFARPILFKLDPEYAHDLTLSKLAMASKSPFLTGQIQKWFGNRVNDLPIKCMGIDFRHPVGLAAGLDKNARALPAFSALGFSGVELGTVTPKPQPGNDKPRMFRLEDDEALINRMGFNSGGVELFVENIKKTQRTAVAGINIGKNAITPIADAHFDYVSAMQRVYAHADYITVNISSPNTKSLRDLQNESFLDHLLQQIKQAQVKCQKVHKRSVPIALKVAPDLTPDEIEIIAELLISHQFDALIATNTTVARPSSLKSQHASEGGGLSGAPVKEMSTDCIRQFYPLLKGRVQIIGVGGIKTVDDAWEKLLAGADYLQIYTQFIYQGPAMIKDIVHGLQAKVQSHGFSDLGEALAQLRKE
ncbi:quinone-dependent dihydroorotate dehydrogenase [Arenicella xantha]|uniref:Dihydroorotate dehydrogenase (quinone) n=1 Tax=Arenicella xantha TaxID=644221 RepID=A0A395JIF7_9GAMM|nr:quinone-dependent dihydroorotate dehydrogenase [Arenicella xantha]RBP49856.1 dihydroorotate oxidase A [Arenicella xantha]